MLWGTSFSGGHVLEVAATDPRIAAVIAQVPFTDGVPTLMRAPLKNVVHLAVAGLRDQVGAWRGRPPRLVPAVGDPGTLAAITAPDAKPGLEALRPPQSLWCNEIAARLMLRLLLYRSALKASRLAMPLLVCACDNDSITPAAPAVKARNVRRAENSGATLAPISSSISTRRSRPTKSSSFSAPSQESPRLADAGALSCCRRRGRRH
ncbi:MAG TPA: hypothetical protein VE197_06735 [Mycobacterium sp.]|nr:hypothetical protein [Mycobacterium sp.]